MSSVSLTRYAWLSVGAAIATISLKAIAYFLTGSVGLLSDAVESFVNLISAIVALFALRVAERPPDSRHFYGHTKAEYFSSVAEGIFIFIAAISIAYAALQRLTHLTPITQPFIGVVVSGIASLINFVVALLLLSAGKKNRSITLEADAHHLLTDVWTSVAVVVGIIVVGITHIVVLDPVIALAVAANICFTAFRILKESAMGFMDTAIPEEETEGVTRILDKYCKNGIKYHGLRSRQSGSRRFITFHVLVPGSWSVRRGHDLLEQMEEEIRSKFDKMTVTTHLEPLEDPRSSEDISIDRQ
jgi:cation diffusion facilitator family transporter